MAKEKNTKKQRKSGKEFCRQHGIPYSTLYYWLRKHRESKVPAPDCGTDVKNGTKQTDLNSFIPVKIRGTSAVQDAFSERPIIEVIYVDGTRVYLPADCGASI